MSELDTTELRDLSPGATFVGRPFGYIRDHEWTVTTHGTAWCSSPDTAPVEYLFRWFDPSTIRDVQPSSKGHSDE